MRTAIIVSLLTIVAGLAGCAQGGEQEEMEESPTTSSPRSTEHSNMTHETSGTATSRPTSQSVNLTQDQERQG